MRSDLRSKDCRPKSAFKPLNAQDARVGDQTHARERLLHDPRREAYLARRASLVRLMDLRRPMVPRSVLRPLRILFVTGTPQEHPELRIAAELTGLRQSVERVRNIAVDVLMNPTLATLKSALDRAGDGYFDVLHYIGYGRCHRDSNSGTLSFAGEHSRIHAVHRHRFADVVRNRGFGLIVLNASESTRTEIVDPFAGIALNLSSVVPAVIAMPFELHDAGSIAFSGALYAAIASGLPIDEAVTRARARALVGRERDASAIAIVLLEDSTSSNLSRSAFGRAARRRVSDKSDTLLEVASQNPLPRANAAPIPPSRADDEAARVRAHQRAVEIATKVQAATIRAQERADEIAAKVQAVTIRAQEHADEIAAKVQAATIRERRLADAKAAKVQAGKLRAHRLVDKKTVKLQAAKVRAQRLADRKVAKLQARRLGAEEAAKARGKAQLLGLENPRWREAQSGTKTKRQGCKLRVAAAKRAASQKPESRGVTTRSTNRVAALSTRLPRSKYAARQTAYRSRELRCRPRDPQGSKPLSAPSPRAGFGGQVQQWCVVVLIIAGIAGANWWPSHATVQLAGHPRTARPWLTVAAPIQHDSEGAATWFKRGVAHYNRGDDEWAIDDFSRAIQRKPDYALAYNNRGIAYGNRAVIYDNLGDYDRAIADYARAIKLKPDYAEAHNNRGFAFENRGIALGNGGDYDRAIADYTRAIKLKPDYVEAYSRRGFVYASQRDYAPAIADYSRAIGLKPEGAEYYNGRGSAYESSGHNGRAVADYSRAIQLRPDNPDSYINRGNAYDGKGDFAPAIADFTRALELKPDDAEAASNLERSGQRDVIAQLMSARRGGHKGEHNRSRSTIRVRSYGRPNLAATNNGRAAGAARGM